MTHFVTGATGFLGRHLLAELVKRDGEIMVLVRPGSETKLARVLERIPGASARVEAVAGDLGSDALGVGLGDSERLAGAQMFHLAGLYDMEGGEEEHTAVNMVGTRNAVRFANQTGVARFHHVSSIAVAGHLWKGAFTEAMFDEGQKLDHPYYRSKFEAERIVREECRVPFRIYRPSLVIGSSETGEADRVDGPYYAFKLIQRLRDALPSWVPLLGLEGGPLNLVPVDFVARALDHIAHLPDADGRTFHIVDPRGLTLGDAMNEFCRAAHAPQFTLRLDRRALGIVPRDMVSMISSWPVAQALRRQLLEAARIPAPVLNYVSNRTRYTDANTGAALAGSGIECPPLHSYAWKVWDYWERHLDPEAPTPRNFRAVLEGQVVLITGASSGIGRALARLLASHGARIVLVARSEEKLVALRDEIAGEGGQAFVYPADLSDMDACQAVLDRVFVDLGPVDILVNNAGRSIRRSIGQSYDRFHDFQRTMQINYFGAVRLMLGVLPGMRARKRGHIINVSSIGVQSYPPRFGAYVASKAALASLSRCVGPEVADDGVAITNVHMPLVRTPMIEPTGMYDSFPTLSPEEAAEMIAAAILTRPPEVSTRLGKLGETVDVVAPGLLQFVMTGAYHAFPESTRREGEGSAEGAEVPAEASMLAYLMRGIHF